MDNVVVVLRPEMIIIMIMIVHNLSSLFLVMVACVEEADQGEGDEAEADRHPNDHPSPHCSLEDGNSQS